MLPCFMHSSGRTVTWIEHQVVAISLHRGHEPTTGHYQCRLRTGGSRFLCDDNQVPISVPHLTAMDENICVVWLTRTGNLTDAYRTVVTRPNPFVPLFRAWMMPEPPGLAVLETADRQSTVDCSPNTGGFAPPVVNEWMHEIYLYLRFCVYFLFWVRTIVGFFVGDIYYIQNVII